MGVHLKLVKSQSKHVASVSGGRTSMGPLLTTLIDKFGRENVDAVFCDTGCEDVDTYRFVRDCSKHFGIDITCIRLVMPKKKGHGCQYQVISIDEIGQDHYAWKQLTSKYGNPYMPGGKFCTQQMKGNIFRKYCAEKYGKDNFFTWIGYRFEEGNRIWGEEASNALGKLGMTNSEKTEFYLECLTGNIEQLLDDYYPSLFPCERDEEEKGKIKKAFDVIEEKKFRFLPEICDFTKPTVNQWWASKSFDLQIGEHLVNCLFCMEKPHAVIMLAIKDRPFEAKKFLSIVESHEVAVKVKRDGSKRDNLIMYREGITFKHLYEKALSMPRDEILRMSIIGKKQAAKNPCSAGECSPFGDMHNQIEIVNL
ncbi:hypothetical protein ACGB6O_000779 [Vibrio parahaemolyticus]